MTEKTFIELTKMDLPQIDTNPKHQVSDDLLKEDEKQSAQTREKFFNLLNELKQKIKLSDPLKQETRINARILKVYLDLLNLIQNNQEGQIVLFECSDFRQLSFSESAKKYGPKSENGMVNAHFAKLVFNGILDPFINAFTNGTHHISYTFKNEPCLIYKKKLLE